MDVHTEHCCVKHGCKYGDPKCTVTTGREPQSFPCEACGKYDPEDEIARLTSELDRERAAREALAVDLEAARIDKATISGAHAAAERDLAAAIQERDDARIAAKITLDDWTSEREAMRRDANAVMAEHLRIAEELQAKAFDQLDDVTRERDEALAREAAALKERDEWREQAEAGAREADDARQALIATGYSADAVGLVDMCEAVLERVNDTESELAAALKERDEALDAQTSAEESLTWWHGREHELLAQVSAALKAKDEWNAAAVNHAARALDANDRATAAEARAEALQAEVEMLRRGAERAGQYHTEINNRLCERVEGLEKALRAGHEAVALYERRGHQIGTLYGWAEDTRALLSGASAPSTAPGERCPHCGGPISNHGPTDKAWCSPAADPSGQETAVYACTNGHEQSHSGACETCGRSTDITRWAPSGQEGEPKP